MKTFRFILCILLLSVSLFPVSSPAQRGAMGSRPLPSLYNNLRVYWNLDETSGDRVASFEAGAASLTLTDNNTVPSAGGRLGRAADFNGTNEFLSIADTPALSIGVTQFSLCFWINRDDDPVGDEIPLAKWDAAGGNREYLVNTWTNGVSTRIEVAVRNSANTTSTFATLDAGLVPGNWYFVHAFADGTNVGISVNLGAPATTAFTSVVRDGTAQFRLGSQSDGVNFFDGKVDMVTLIVGRVATSAELTYLYNSADGRAPL